MKKARCIILDLEGSETERAGSACSTDDSRGNLYVILWPLVQLRRELREKPGL